MKTILLLYNTLGDEAHLALALGLVMQNPQAFVDNPQLCE